MGQVAFGTVFVLLGIESLYVLISMPHVDWQTYVNAWGRFVSGGDLYGAAQLQGPDHLIDQVLSGYAYPPPAVILMAPFTALPFGEVVWHLINIGAFVTGVAAIVRREVGWLSPGALACAIFPLLLVAPFWDGVITGNVNLLMVGLLAWAWAMPGRWIGPVSALLGIVHIFPGSLGVQRLRATGWRGLLVPVIVTVGLVVLTLPLVGIHSWMDYATALSNATAGCDKQVNSVACVLAPMIGASLAKTAVLGLAAICALGAIAVKPPLASFTLVATAWVVPYPDLSPHYLLPLYLPICIIGARAFRRWTETDAQAAQVPSAAESF